jgi:hypothetical protein
MTLREFMATLKTAELKITLYDSEASEIVIFYSPGYLGVESDILNSTIDKWLVISDKELKVYTSYTVPSDDTDPNIEP